MGGSEASGEPIRPSARAPIERLRGGGGDGGLRLGGGRGLGQGTIGAWTKVFCCYLRCSKARQAARASAHANLPRYRRNAEK